jgi:predicted SAM-dependent methyltransferase
MLPQPLPQRINVGCGYDHRPGFLNVDMDPACKPDLLLKDNDFSVLPRRHFSELVAMDVLEHIPRALTMPALLEWADLMQVGGRMTLETSSILGVARMLMARPSFQDQHTCTIYLYGNQAHAGDFHHTGFTETTLRTYVLSAGFEIHTFVERDNWIFLLEATRVLDWTALLGSATPDAEFVEAAYQASLFRSPQEPFTSAHLRELAEGRPRRDLLKQLFGSLERNYRIAQRNGW